MAEIVLKWWSLRTDRENLDMSFMERLFQKINSYNSEWYYNVRSDKRYKHLMEIIDIPEYKAKYIFYNSCDGDNKRILKDCISKGGIPIPIPSPATPGIP